MCIHKNGGRRESFLPGTKAARAWRSRAQRPPNNQRIFLGGIFLCQWRPLELNQAATGYEPVRDTRLADRSKTPDARSSFVFAFTCRAVEGATGRLDRPQLISAFQNGGPGVSPGAAQTSFPLSGLRFSQCRGRPFRAGANNPFRADPRLTGEGWGRKPCRSNEYQCSEGAWVARGKKNPRA